eukprot:1157263-Pelagomonas_calceolata.AAC.12
MKSFYACQQPYAVLHSNYEQDTLELLVRLKCISEVGQCRTSTHELAYTLRLPAPSLGMSPCELHSSVYPFNQNWTPQASTLPT